MFHVYKVIKKEKIFHITYNRVVYTTTQANHVGLFMWMKNTEDYTFFKDDEQVFLGDVYGQVRLKDTMDFLIEKLLKWKTEKMALAEDGENNG